jgi:Phage terminase large subunit (GpA)
MPRRSPGYNYFLRSQFLENALSTVETSIEPEKGLPSVSFFDGGQWFLDSLHEHGITEGDKPIRMSTALLEAAELIADGRFHKVSTGGAAQVFKSLLHWNLAAALITVGQMRLLWAFPQRKTIYKIVPKYFKPIIAHWEKALGQATKRLSSDSKAIDIHQSRYGSAQFEGVNDPGQANRSLAGGAAAGAGVVSVAVDWLLGDERSQYPPGATDTLRVRTIQSAISTQPERWIGTPGNGAGIEKEIRDSDYDFWPHTTCRSCQAEIKLSPLDCLIKNTETDSLKTPRYFDKQGRPLEWYHADPSKPITSAYYACPECGVEINRDDRINSHFRCIKTGQSLRAIIDDLPKGYAPSIPLSAGLTLSPLIRDTEGNNAPKVIEAGVIGDNPKDWQQQGLGIPTTVTGGGITIDMLRYAVSNPIPENLPAVYGYGLDQGTAEHWIVIVKFRPPGQLLYGAPLTPVEIFEKAHREIALAAPVSLAELHGDWGDRHLELCEGGAIDNEPDRQWAVKWRQKTNALLFDQRGGRELGGKVWAPKTVAYGGESIDDVVGCDTHRLQSMILGFFQGGLYTVTAPCNPEDIKGRTSLARHLITSQRDPETHLWQRPTDKVDDLLKALMGAELWWYLRCFGELPKSSGSGFWDINI